MSDTGGGAARLIARMRGVPLGVRLVLLSVAITILVVGAAFFALRARVESDVTRVFATELEHTQRRSPAGESEPRALLPHRRCSRPVHTARSDRDIPRRSKLGPAQRADLRRPYSASRAHVCRLDSDLLLVRRKWRTLAGWAVVSKR